MASSRSEIAALVGALVLLAIGGQGLANVHNDLHSVTTLQQRALTSMQLGYVVVTPLALLARWRRSRWTLLLLVLWGVLLTGAAGLSPSAWGGASLEADLLAGLGTAAVALLVGWLFLRGGSPEPVHPSV